MKTTIRCISLLAGLIVAGQASATTVCSWRLDGLGQQPVDAGVVAQVLNRCDLVALQGIAAPGGPDAIQIGLELQGGSWAQLPPTVDAPDKAFLWRRDAVRFVGRALGYAGAARGYSARFSTRDGQAFVLGNFSSSAQPEDAAALVGYVGFLKAQYPEDPSRWLIAGDTGIAPTDVALRDLRRSVRPLISGLRTKAPESSLETGSDSVRTRVEPPQSGEPSSQIWVPIAGRLSIQQAGVIPYLGQLTNHSRLGISPERARKIVGENLPVFAVIAASAPGKADAVSPPSAETYFIADAKTRKVVASTCQEAGQVPRSRTVAFPTVSAAQTAGYLTSDCTTLSQ